MTKRMLPCLIEKTNLWLNKETPPKIIVIAGNIGAGKSTCLKQIEEICAQRQKTEMNAELEAREKAKKREEERRKQVEGEKSYGTFMMEQTITLFYQVGMMCLKAADYANRLKNRENYEKVQVVLEPVGKWTEKPVNEDGTLDDSILELYYKDSSRYAFSFQMYALQTRFSQLMEMMETQKGKTLLYERCPLSDYNIFAKLLHKNKIISTQEFNIYKEWFNMTYKAIQPNICAIIYLKVPVSVCASRIVKRNRDGEENIKEDYLRDLEKMHEEWLEDSNQMSIPIYTVEHEDEHYEKIAYEPLFDFINKVY